MSTTPTEFLYILLIDDHPFVRNGLKAFIFSKLQVVDRTQAMLRVR